MPINLALNTALSGLLASQQALDTISNNIANLNNPNYDNKTVNLEERVLSGVGAGVQVSSITRDVNQALNDTLNSASGTLNALQSTSQYNTQIENMFGQPGSGSSISDLLQSLGNSFSTLANNANLSPSSTVEAAQTVTSSLQSMTTQLQGLRVQADQQISQDVGQVNTILQNIAGLNSQIATENVAGIDVSELEDQRDAQLTQLSSYINYTTFTRSDGTISIYTSQGTPLLDGVAQTLTHNSASQIEPQMTYAGGELQGITVSGPSIEQEGEDITGQLTGGAIGALIQLRDDSLPNLQNQIDTLGQTLQNGLNQLNNQGVSYPDGGQSFTGTTTFLDPSQQTITLSGGDTAIVLLNGDGTQKASTTLSLLMKQYLQSAGEPTGNSWTINQVSGALNGWLNTQYGTSGISYAAVDQSGNFSIQLPQTSSTTIAFRDEQTSTFQSTISNDPTTALGLNGPLTLTDSAGNVYSVNVAASDSLTDIMNKLNAQSGITASLVPNSSGSGDYLQVTNNQGNDMYINPDGPGATAQSGLGLLPSGSNQATNVGVNFNSDGLGTSFTTNEYPSGTSVPGINGVLTFMDQTGVMAQVPVTAGMTLNTIANAINAAGGGKLNASIVTVGNQVALSVADVAGNQMSVTGANDPIYQSTSSPIAAPFNAVAAASLTVTPGSGAPVTIGTPPLPANATLQQIASTINANSSFQAAGIAATVENDGTNQWLDVYSATGQALSFSGSLVGAGAGQLNFNYTASTSAGADPKTALGLAPPADQTVDGFANFLGLNDLLVTNQPQTTFQSQTLSTNFTTTKPSNLELSDSSFQNGDPATGAAQSLNLSFAAGMTLQAIAAQINSQAVTYQGNHTLINGFTAQAGTLTIENNPTILGTVTINAGDSLNTIASNINANASLSAAGVRAVVGTDGTTQWLQLYDQQGQPLQMSETMTSPGATPQLTFNATQVATAAVVNDGAGERLQITHSANATMNVAGTLSSQTNIGPAAVGTALNLQVRSDIAANSSLMSRGALQYDASTNQFYAGVADNTITQAMASFMSSPVSFASAGGLGQGSFSLPQYASNIVSTAATAANNTQTQLTYQQTLVNNLTTQKGSVSGVNLDSELSNLLAFQQSYSASAKVISTMQQLFQVLDDIIQ